MQLGNWEDFEPLSCPDFDLNFELLKTENWDFKIIQGKVEVELIFVGQFIPSSLGVDS